MARNSPWDSEKTTHLCSFCESRKCAMHKNADWKNGICRFSFDGGFGRWLYGILPLGKSQASNLFLGFPSHHSASARDEKEFPTQISFCIPFLGILRSHTECVSAQPEWRSKREKGLTKTSSPLSLYTITQRGFGIVVIFSSFPPPIIDFDIFIKKPFYHFPPLFHCFYTFSIAEI